MTHYDITLTGGITGSMWWPVGAQGSIDIRVNLSNEADRMCDSTDPDYRPTLRDVLMSILCERGGDFSGSMFTGDTILTVTSVGNGRRRSRDWELTAFPSVSDIVNADVFSYDFGGDDY